MIQMFDRSKKFICQVHNLVQTFGCTVLFKCILTLNCSACSWVIAGFLGHVCVAVCKLGTCSQDLQPVMDNRPAMVKPHFILDDVLPWWGGGVLEPPSAPEERRLLICPFLGSTLTQLLSRQMGPHCQTWSVGVMELTYQVHNILLD